MSYFLPRMFSCFIARTSRKDFRVAIVTIAPVDREGHCFLGVASAVDACGFFVSQSCRTRRLDLCAPAATPCFPLSAGRSDLSPSLIVVLSTVRLPETRSEERV